MISSERRPRSNEGFSGPTVGSARSTPVVPIPTARVTLDSFRQRVYQESTKSLPSVPKNAKEGCSHQVTHTHTSPGCHGEKMSILRGSVFGCGSGHDLL